LQPALAPPRTFVLLPRAGVDRGGSGGGSSRHAAHLAPSRSCGVWARRQSCTTYVAPNEVGSAKAGSVEKAAKAQGITKMKEAMSGAGGRTMVKLRIADALKRKRIALFPRRTRRPTCSRPTRTSSSSRRDSVGKRSERSPYDFRRVRNQMALRTARSTNT